MNRIGLMLAIALVVVSNAFVLIGVRSNRAGTAVQTIELTERELVLQSQPEDNSGVTLRLTWLPRQFGPTRAATIGREKLQELGFDCANPSGSTANERRLPPREACVALEYQGPAWEHWLKERENEAEPDSLGLMTTSDPRSSIFKDRTRLFWVDAARNADVLLHKYPDREKYVIVRAVIAAALSADDASTKSWHGWVSEILPSEIHVPLPFAKLLSELGPKTGEEPRYTVTLQYGRRLEPWVSGVKLLDKK